MESWQFLGEEKAPRAGRGWWAWHPALVLWRKAVRYHHLSSLHQPSHLGLQVTSRHWEIQEFPLATSSSASSTLSSLTSSRPEIRLVVPLIWFCINVASMTPKLHWFRTQYLKFVSKPPVFRGFPVLVLWPSTTVRFCDRCARAAYILLKKVIQAISDTHYC